MTTAPLEVNRSTITVKVFNMLYVLNEVVLSITVNNYLCMWKLPITGELGSRAFKYTVHDTGH